MEFDALKKSLADNNPPEELAGPLLALWWDAKGEWEKAHETAQSVNNSDGAWVHAYLHRKEGDDGNAGYWYSRAGKPHSSLSLDEEWEEIVQSLLYNND